MIPYEEIHKFTRAALVEKGITEERLSRFKPTTIKRKNDEKLEPAFALLQDVCGNLDDPATGIAFALPVSKVVGLAPELGEGGGTA